MNQDSVCPKKIQFLKQKVIEVHKLISAVEEAKTNERKALKYIKSISKQYVQLVSDKQAKDTRILELQKLLSQKNAELSNSALRIEQLQQVVSVYDEERREYGTEKVDELKQRSERLVQYILKDRKLPIETLPYWFKTSYEKQILRWKRQHLRRLSSARPNNTALPSPSLSSATSESGFDSMASSPWSSEAESHLQLDAILTRDQPSKNANVPASTSLLDSDNTSSAADLLPESQKNAASPGPSLSPACDKSVDNDVMQRTAENNCLIGETLHGGELSKANCVPVEVPMETDTVVNKDWIGKWIEHSADSQNMIPSAAITNPAEQVTYTELRPVKRGGNSASLFDVEHLNMPQLEETPVEHSADSQNMIPSAAITNPAEQVTYTELRPMKRGGNSASLFDVEHLNMPQLEEAPVEHSADSQNMLPSVAITTPYQVSDEEITPVVTDIIRTASTFDVDLQHNMPQLEDIPVHHVADSQTIISTAAIIITSDVTDEEITPVMTDVIRTESIFDVDLQHNMPQLEEIPVHRDCDSQYLSSSAAINVIDQVSDQGIGPVVTSENPDMFSTQSIFDVDIQHNVPQLEEVSVHQKADSHTTNFSDQVNEEEIGSMKTGENPYTISTEYIFVATIPVHQIADSHSGNMFDKVNEEEIMKTGETPYTINTEPILDVVMPVHQIADSHSGNTFDKVNEEEIMKTGETPYTINTEPILDVVIPVHQIADSHSGNMFDKVNEEEIMKTGETPYTINTEPILDVVMPVHQIADSHSGNTFDKVNEEEIIGENHDTIKTESIFDAELQHSLPQLEEIPVQNNTDSENMLSSATITKNADQVNVEGIKPVMFGENHDTVRTESIFDVEHNLPQLEEIPVQNNTDSQNMLSSATITKNADQVNVEGIKPVMIGENHDTVRTESIFDVEHNLPQLQEIPVQNNTDSENMLSSATITKNADHVNVEGIKPVMIGENRDKVRTESIFDVEHNLPQLEEIPVQNNADFQNLLCSANLTNPADQVTDGIKAVKTCENLELISEEPLFDVGLQHNLPPLEEIPVLRESAISISGSTEQDEIVTIIDSIEDTSIPDDDKIKEIFKEMILPTCISPIPLGRKRNRDHLHKKLYKLQPISFVRESVASVKPCSTNYSEAVKSTDVSAAESNSRIAKELDINSTQPGVPESTVEPLCINPPVLFEEAVENVNFLNSGQTLVFHCAENSSQSLMPESNSLDASSLVKESAKSPIVSNSIPSMDAESHVEMSPTLTDHSTNCHVEKFVDSQIVNCVVEESGSNSGKEVKSSTESKINVETHLADSHTEEFSEVFRNSITESYMELPRDYSPTRETQSTYPFAVTNSVQSGLSMESVNGDSLTGVGNSGITTPVIVNFKNFSPVESDQEVKKCEVFPVNGGALRETERKKCKLICSEESGIREESVTVDKGVKKCKVFLTDDSSASEPERERRELITKPISHIRTHSESFLQAEQKIHWELLDTPNSTILSPYRHSSTDAMANLGESANSVADVEAVDDQLLVLSKKTLVAIIAEHCKKLKDSMMEYFENSCVVKILPDNNGLSEYSDTLDEVNRDADDMGQQQIISAENDIHDTVNNAKDDNIYDTPSTVSQVTAAKIVAENPDGLETSVPREEVEYSDSDENSNIVSYGNVVMEGRALDMAEATEENKMADDTYPFISPEARSVLEDILDKVTKSYYFTEYKRPMDFDVPSEDPCLDVNGGQHSFDRENAEERRLDRNDTQMQHPQGLRNEEEGRHQWLSLNNTHLVNQMVSPFLYNLDLLNAGIREAPPSNVPMEPKVPRRQMTEIRETDLEGSTEVSPRFVKPRGEPTIEVSTEVSPRFVKPRDEPTMEVPTEVSPKFAKPRDEPTIGVSTKASPRFVKPRDEPTMEVPTEVSPKFAKPRDEPTIGVSTKVSPRFVKPRDEPTMEVPTEVSPRFAKPRDEPTIGVSTKASPRFVKPRDEPTMEVPTEVSPRFAKPRDEPTIGVSTKASPRFVKPRDEPTMEVPTEVSPRFVKPRDEPTLEVSAEVSPKFVKHRDEDPTIEVLTVSPAVDALSKLVQSRRKFFERRAHSTRSSTRAFARCLSEREKSSSAVESDQCLDIPPTPTGKLSIAHEKSNSVTDVTTARLGDTDSCSDQVKSLKTTGRRKLISSKKPKLKQYFGSDSEEDNPIGSLQESSKPDNVQKPPKRGNPFDSPDIGRNKNWVTSGINISDDSASSKNYNIATLPDISKKNMSASKRRKVSDSDFSLDPNCVAKAESDSAYSKRVTRMQILDSEVLPARKRVAGKVCDSYILQDPKRVAKAESDSDNLPDYKRVTRKQIRDLSQTSASATPTFSKFDSFDIAEIHERSRLMKMKSCAITAAGGQLMESRVRSAGEKKMYELSADCPVIEPAFYSPVVASSGISSALPSSKPVVKKMDGLSADCPVFEPAFYSPVVAPCKVDVNTFSPMRECSSAFSPTHAVVTSPAPTPSMVAAPGKKSRKRKLKKGKKGVTPVTPEDIPEPTFVDEEEREIWKVINDYLTCTTGRIHYAGRCSSLFKKTTHHVKIIRVIVRILVENVDETPDFTPGFTPGLTPTQKHLFILLFPKVPTISEKMTIDLLQALRQVFIPDKFQYDDDSIANCVRFFVTVCHRREDRLAVSLLCLDAAVEMPQRAVVVVYAAISVWPEIMPYANDADPFSPGPTTALLLMLPSMSSKIRKGQTQLLGITRRLFHDKFGYELNPKLDVWTRKAIESLRAGSKSAANAIKAVHRSRGWKWSGQGVVRPLLETLGAWPFGVVSDANAYVILDVVKTIVSHAVDAGPFRHEFIRRLCEILQTGKLSPAGQETLVRIIISTNFPIKSRPLIEETLRKWTPSWVVASQVTADIARFSHPPKPKPKKKAKRKPKKA